MEMPGRMAEHRKRDGEAEEKRYRGDEHNIGDNDAQPAIGIGLAITALTEVTTAVTTPTSRSRIIGNETTEMVNTMAANTKPAKVPTIISDHPASVVTISVANWAMDSGTTFPKYFT